MRAAVAMLALSAAIVVVAVAAQAPLSRSTPVDARSAQAPTTALFMLLLGVGIVMVAALLVVLWSGRRRKDDPPEHEPTPIVLHWFWKLVAMLVPLALGAALIAAAVLGARPAHYAPPSTGGGYGLLSLQHAPTTNNRRAGFALPAWLPWTVLGILGVAIAAGLVVLWLRRHRPVTEAAGQGTAEAAVGAAIEALDAEADARRAVIAAYGAMQRTFAEHGVVRPPAEAPREYLGRTLVASRATEQEASTLTGLFEEARYSIHPIPERLRKHALSTLRSLQGRLRAEGAE